VVTGALVTHGGFGDALLRTVEGFLGPQSHLVAVSNAGLTTDGLREAIRGAVADLDDAEELYLFTDLGGGSCAGACTRLVATRPGTVCLAGVNLPMLLEFCHYRERLGGEELLERVMRKGRDGIVATRGAPSP